MMDRSSAGSVDRSGLNEPHLAFVDRDQKNALSRCSCGIHYEQRCDRQEKPMICVGLNMGISNLNMGISNTCAALCLECCATVRNAVVLFMMS